MIEKIVTYLDCIKTLPRQLKTMKRLCSVSYTLSIYYEFVTFLKRFSSRSFFVFSSFILVRDLNLLMSGFSYFYLFQNYSTGKMAVCKFLFFKRI